MPFGNALLLFALYIVSVCEAFPFFLLLFLISFALACAFGLFILFLAHASFILRCAVCFITCQTFFIFSALLAFMYEVLAIHIHTHTHALSLRFRLKAFLSTLSLSLAALLSLFYFFLLFSLLASSTGNVTDHQVVLENGQKING